MTFPHEPTVEPESVGMESERLRKVVRRFEAQQETGRFPGGQIAVRRKGKSVVNHACGIARGLRPEERKIASAVDPWTPFPVLSAGKPVGAVAIALLEDRGELEANAPVANFLPGFERQGKGEITLLDVLTHRAGILLPDLVQRPKEWSDRESVVRHLVEAEPKYERGTFAYMPYEFGWILSEVVLRVTGSQLAKFAAQELFGPMGLHDLSFGLGGREIGDLAFSYWLGGASMEISGIEVAADFEERNNSYDQFDSLNPAVSLVSDAASLAAFYEFLVEGGVTHGGKRLVSEATLRTYTTRNYVGWERNSKAFSSVGRGFILGANFPTIYGWRGTTGCFGHPGGLAVLAFGDHETGVAAAIVTNGNRSFVDLAKRFMPLAAGIRRACH